MVRSAPGPVRVLLVGGNGQQAARVEQLLDRARSQSFVCAHVAFLPDAEDHPEAKAADLLLLAVGRAHDHGVSLVGRARVAFPELPVVVLGDVGDEAAASAVLAAGARGYILRGELSTRSLVVTLTAAIGQRAAEHDLDLDESDGPALLDPVTGLPNGWLFHDRLEQALASAKRSRCNLAVLQIQLEGYDAMCTSFGEETTSTVLRMVGERLTAGLRTSDTVARVGTHEFAVLLSHLDDPVDAARLASTFVASLGRPYVVSAGRPALTASIGVACVPGDGDDPGKLVGHAKRAMRRAVEQGSGCFVFHSESLNTAVARRTAIEAWLEEAIATDGLSVYYQPQFDLRRDRIVGAEALVRWDHPALGPLGPEEFLPVAEDRGLLGALGLWVMRTACRHAAAWQRAGHRGVRISVNVAPPQLRDPAFPSTVRSVLRETDLRPDSLELEITESSFVENVDAVAQVFHDLRQVGVKLAIDDFGTGYSALCYLKRLPVDTLKIDRSFVCDVAENPVNATITETIVRLAQGLGLATVAEGVETAEQLLSLGAFGCHRVQGFLFGRPAPPERFLEWLADPPFSWKHPSAA